MVRARGDAHAIVARAASGLRRDRVRQLGVVLVGTGGSALRSLSQRLNGDRFGAKARPEAEAEAEEPLVQPRPVVTELNAIEERKRRAAG